MRGSSAAHLVGRVVFGWFFVLHGLVHFRDGLQLASLVAARGIPFPLAGVYITGFLLMVGGALVMVGVLPRVGLALIGLFLLLVTPIMHPFWLIEDPVARTVQQVSFEKNAALFGGALALFALTPPWPASLPAVMRRRARRPVAQARGPDVGT